MKRKPGETVENQDTEGWADGKRNQGIDWSGEQGRSPEREGTNRCYSVVDSDSQVS